MKKIALITIMVIAFSYLSAQKTEYRLALNSGLFSFSGRSAEAVTFINHSQNLNISYTNNPYGSKQGTCYGVSGIMKHVSKGNFAFGCEMGYERLRSKIGINSVAVSDLTGNQSYDADGETFLNFDFINFQPFAGYRFATKQLNFDLTAGLDIAFCLDAKEKGEAVTANKITYTTSVSRKTITTDVRPRIQLSADHKRFGIYAGYSIGLANYKSGYIGGTNECYARLFRFGVTYLLN